jgi:hypothetical protein
MRSGGLFSHNPPALKPSIMAAAANATDAAKVKPAHSVQAWATNYLLSNPNAPNGRCA